jgi:uncharacterized membrane protein
MQLRMRRQMTGAARAPARVLHPVLSQLSLGLLAVGTALDVLSRGKVGGLTGLSFWLTSVGIAFGAWCATWSLLDWVLVARLGQRGVWGADAFAMTTIIGLYALSAIVRIHRPAHGPPDGALVLEVTGFALIALRSWVAESSRLG